jgi:hypothetical protein
MRALLRGWGICFCVLGAAGATARATETQPAQAQPEAAPAAIVAPQLTLEPNESPNSIDAWLKNAYDQPAGLLPYGPVSLFDPLWKRMNKGMDSVGLSVGLAYTATFQAASNGPGNRDAAGGDFDLFGNWRLWGKKNEETTGYLYFAGEYRGSLFADQVPSQLGGQIGSLWGTVNGFSNQVFTMKELYWEQRFLKDRILLRIGKLDPENYYNSNYWQSDSKYFMNAAFSSFPVRAFPGQGLGLNATV